MTEAAVRDLDALCSVRDVSEHFKIPIATVQTAAKRGSIPGCIKVLGRYYFDKEQVIAGWTPAAVTLRTTGPSDNKGPGKKGFQKGNTLGVSNRGGRPKRAVETRYLKALSDAVSPEDWLEIIERAVVQAKDGEWRARAWLSNYLIGTPVQKISAEIEVIASKDFDTAERAAAVRALLDEAKRRTAAKIIDVTPKVASDDPN